MTQSLIKTRLVATQAARRRFVKENEEKIELLAEAIAYPLVNGRKILICGNGGSATDAMHFTGELTGKLKKDRIPLPAICLNSEIAGLTAIANDYGYDFIFQRLVQALGQPSDIFIGISTSGNSQNVINAALEAKSRNCYVVGLTGGGGGELKGLCDTCLIVTDTTDTAVIQETHMFALHTLAGLIELKLGLV